MTSLANQMFFYNLSLQSEPTIKDRGLRHWDITHLSTTHEPFYLLQYAVNHADHELLERTW